MTEIFVLFCQALFSFGPFIDNCIWLKGTFDSNPVNHSRCNYETALARILHAPVITVEKVQINVVTLFMQNNVFLFCIIQFVRLWG